MVFQNCAKGVLSKNLINEQSSSSEIPQGETPPVQEVVHIFQNLPLNISAIDEGASALLGPGVSRETNLDYLRAFVAKDNQVIISDATIGIDSSLTYTISGVFKADGTAGATLSFGFVPFSSDEKEMRAWEYFRAGNAVGIADITPMGITTSAALAGWQTGAGPANTRGVGFYFDGDTNHAPDYLYHYWKDPKSVDPADGAYNSAAGTSIGLNGSLPVSLVTTVQQNPNTVILNHRDGPWHVYAAATETVIPEVWTVFSGTITGEVYNPTPNQFPAGIQYAKLVVLAKFPDAPEAKVLFTNIKITAE